MYERRRRPCMELLSPAYSARYLGQHGEWFAKQNTPDNPRARELWLRHRELGWDNTSRKYTPPSVYGIKPMTLEPWADETMTVDSSWDRIGGSKKDVQGQILHGMMSYHAAHTHTRHTTQTGRSRSGRGNRLALNTSPTSPPGVVSRSSNTLRVYCVIGVHTCGTSDSRG